MLITKSEFARQMGVSAAAVSNAVKSGRLTLADGKRLDPNVAAIQWEANRRRAPSVKPLPYSELSTHRRNPPLPVAPHTAYIPGAVDLDADALWITMNWYPADLPEAVRYWIELKTGQAPPALVNALVNLLHHLAENINRIQNPEPDEDINEL